MIVKGKMSNLKLNHLQDFITFYKHYPLLPACSGENDGVHCISRPDINSLKVSEHWNLKKGKKKKNRKLVEVILEEKICPIFCSKNFSPSVYNLHSWHSQSVGEKYACIPHDLKKISSE